MSSLRYKTLLSYLPGMATVVNAFESPQVQGSVYETLMQALEGKLQAEGLGAANGVLSSRDPHRFAPVTNGEVTHELVEGDSIHADLNRNGGQSTVF